MCIIFSISLVLVMPPPTVSGIVDTGAKRVVPSSVRADGSVRKEIRIRTGFVPQEDVAKYTNRRVEAANYQSQYPIGYTPPEDKEEHVKAAKKKKKHKKTEHVEPNVELVDVTDISKPTLEQTALTIEAIDPVKKAKSLEKKLRQIEQLKERKEKGDILLPEQLEKLDKASEIEAELANLKL